MNLRKKLLLCFLICCICNLANSQDLNFGLTFNVGLSKIPTILSSFEGFNTEYTLSGNAGFYLEKNITKKSSLGIELLWVQAEGKETSTGELFAPNMSLGRITDEDRTHISYIGLPIYYRLQFGKLGLKLGAQPMAFLFASSDYHSFGELNGEPFSNSSKTKGIKLDSFNVGPKVGIDFAISDALRVRADYYHGLSDIDIKQITLGINFRLSSKGELDKD